MQGNTPLVNILRQHAFIIFWVILALFMGIKLSIIGFTNRHEISPLTAFVSEFTAMSFWLAVAPALVRLLRKLPISETKNLRIYIPVMLIISIFSLCWSSLSDLITTPGTPSFSTQMALKLMYQLGWEILLGSVFLGLLFWSRVGSITLIVPSDEEGREPVVKFKVTFNNRTFYINSESILSIEAKDYYAELNTGENHYLIREPIYRLAENLFKQGFLQVSRSAIVNKKFVQSINKDKGRIVAELADGTKIKVSRTYLKSLQAGLEQAE